MVASSTLLLAALVGFVAATVCVIVGWQLHRRAGSTPETQRAIGFFVAWWHATAANIYVGSLFYAAASFGASNFELQYAYTQLQRVLLATSLWGLLTYLVFLVSGRLFPRTIGAFYGAHAVFMLYTITAARPDGLYLGAWRTDLTYAVDTPAAWSLVTFTGIVLPPVLLSVAYFVAIFRMPRAETEPRYRAALVSTSLVAWWILAVVAGQRSSFDLDGIQIANRLVTLGAALVILMAYRPPEWIRRRIQTEAPTIATA